MTLLTLPPLLTLLTFSPLRTLALTADNPYLSLTNRNLFALKAPPKPPTEEELRAKEPPPPITLTGITTIFGSKKALLIMGVVTAKPAPPPQPLGRPGFPVPPPAAPAADPNKPQSFILCEGQREGNLEVIKIDEKAGSVDIAYNGQRSTLTFKENGVKTAAAAAAPATLPPTGVANPSFQPSPVQPAGFTPTTGIPMPIRPTRTDSTGMDGTVQPAGTEVAPPGIVGGMVQPGHFKPVMPVIAPEEQQILMLAEEAKHADDPTFPPMPPTELKDLLNAEQNPPGQTPPVPTGPPGF